MYTAVLDVIIGHATETLSEVTRNLPALSPKTAPRTLAPNSSEGVPSWEVVTPCLKTAPPNLLCVYLP
jgi:hypothetical protein